MFPWVYGFAWQTENIVFLAIFYSVAAIILMTLGVAALRAFHDLKSNRLEKMKWQIEFEDLPHSARTCRHVFTGELKSRICTNGFDCRSCKVHTSLTMSQKGCVRSLKSKELFLGLGMPEDRMYHRGHTWVRKEVDKTLTIGLDEFADRVMGTSREADLPDIGAELCVNGTGWYFRNGESKVRVLSPVDGKVIEVGGRDAGFYLKVKPGDDCDLRNLLKGPEILPWITREMERLEMALGNKEIGISLADGGELMKDIASNYPDADWDAVLGEIFLEP